MMTGPWLDNLELDPATDRFINQGAAWQRTSRETFASDCVSRYINDLCLDPAFIDAAVQWYVKQTVADSPNAAQIFELR